MTDFLKQESSPLFEKVLWNRPVSRRAGGRLLLVGGGATDFSLLHDISRVANSAGAGQCHLFVPDSLRKLVGDNPDVTFGVSNPSGSLGKGALAAILETAKDYDAVAIGASLGGNSETATLVESLAEKLEIPVVFFDEALEIIKHRAELLTRANRLVILNTKELYKLAGKLKIGLPVGQGGVLGKVAPLQTVKDKTDADYVLFGNEVITAAGNTVVVTNINYVPEPAVVYGLMAIFWIQNRTLPQEGLATAAFVLAKANGGETHTVTAATKQIQEALSEF